MSKMNGFTEVLQTPSSLKLFLKKMDEFDKKFCGLMMEGVDFNIRLEIRGDKGAMIHCRVVSDSTERLPNEKSSNQDRKE